MPLLGGAGYRAKANTDQPRLGERYGSLAADLRSLIAHDSHLAEPLVPGLPYIKAEAVYAAQSEMAVTLDDVLSRRTRARLFDRPASIAAAEDVARLIAADMGWDDAEVERQVADFRTSCAAEQTAGRMSEVDLLEVNP